MMHRTRSRTKSTVVAHLSATRSCPARPQPPQACTRRVPQDAFGPRPGKQAEPGHQPAFSSSFRMPESALRAARCSSAELCYSCARAAARCFLEPNSIFFGISRNPFLGCSKTFGAPVSGSCTRSVYLAKPWLTPSRTREPVKRMPLTDQIRDPRSIRETEPLRVPAGVPSSETLPFWLFSCRKLLLSTRWTGAQRWRSPRKIVWLSMTTRGMPEFGPERCSEESAPSVR